MRPYLGSKFSVFIVLEPLYDYYFGIGAALGLRSPFMMLPENNPSFIFFVVANKNWHRSKNKSNADYFCFERDGFMGVAGVRGV